jgi:hypothetical protein
MQQVLLVYLKLNLGAHGYIIEINSNPPGGGGYPSSSPYPTKEAVKFQQFIAYSFSQKLPRGHLCHPQPSVYVCFFSALHNGGAACTRGDKCSAH